MAAEPDLPRIARTIGDPTRIRMLTLLMEGRALTAKELAHGAGVGPATATAHLRRLYEAALVASAVQGRHKYFRLASPEVAHCVESLLAIAPTERVAPERPREPIHEARFCYDHLAGRLGIEITRTLVARKLLLASDGEFQVSARGHRWFEQLGVDLAAVAAKRRHFARSCLDWSERRDHLGGALGAALASHLMASGWIKRRPGTRIVTVTPRGRDGLEAQLGLRWE